jgi:hypothetical protein
MTQSQQSWQQKKRFRIRLFNGCSGIVMIQDFPEPDSRPSQVSGALLAQTQLVPHHYAGRMAAAEVAEDGVIRVS